MNGKWGTLIALGFTVAVLRNVVENIASPKKRISLIHYASLNTGSFYVLL